MIETETKTNAIVLPIRWEDYPLFDDAVRGYIGEQANATVTIKKNYIGENYNISMTLSGNHYNGEALSLEAGKIKAKEIYHAFLDKYGVAIQ